MNVALIAHDSKKELMVQFCIAYCGILSRYNICATGTTGKLVSEATGLHIQRFMSGPQGGDQQLASSISCNEIDLLLFFPIALIQLFKCIVYKGIFVPCIFRVCGLGCNLDDRGDGPCLSEGKYQ